MEKKNGNGKEYSYGKKYYNYNVIKSNDMNKRDKDKNLICVIYELF